MKHKLLTALLITIAAAAPAAAAETRVLTLDDCLALALKNNKDFVMAQKDYEIKLAAEKSTESDLYPQFSLSGKAYLLDPHSVDSGNFSTLAANAKVTNPAFLSPNSTYALNYSASLGVNYPLFTGFRQWNAFRLARESTAIARKTFDKIRIDTKATVSKAFYGLLVADKLLELVKSNDERLKAYLEVAQRNFNAGMISQYELLRSQVQLANNKPELLASQNRVSLARVQLLQLLALDLDTDFRTDGKLETDMLTVVEKDALAKAMANRIDLQLIDLNVRVLELAEQIAYGNKWPTVAAFLNVGLDYRLDPVSSVNSYGMWTDPGRKLVPSWQVGIQASWGLNELFSFFIPSKVASDAKQATLGVEKARTLKEKTIDLIRLEVRNAVLTLEQNAKTLVANREAIAMSTEGLRIARIRFENGQMGNVELMDAELDYQRSQTYLYQTWFAYVSAKIDLEKAMGVY